MQGLKLYVIGVKSGEGNILPPESEEILSSCHHIFLSERFYNHFKETELKDRLVLFPEKLSALPAMIAEKTDSIGEGNKKNVAVLATGDPNFFGVTQFLKKRFPEAEVVVIPNVSTMQQAFARLCLSWQDASFMSLHGREKEGLLSFLLKSNKGFIFTSGAEDVLSTLNTLREHRLDDYDIFIIEDIGTRREKITHLTFPYLLKEHVSALNVIIFLRHNAPGEYAGLGLSEVRYRAKAGMITKREVRVNVISMLSLKSGHVLWDVGAGSGSVSIEASFNPLGVLCFAIERDEEAYLNLKEAFSAWNVKPVFSDFSHVCDILPQPDRIFIGGGQIKKTLPIAFEKLKKDGLIVISAVSVINFIDAVGFAEEKGVEYEIVQINVNRKESIKNSALIKANNPVFVITIKKNKLF